MHDHVARQALNRLPSIEALDRKDVISRASAQTDALRQGTKARKVKALYDQSPARFYMTFQEFKSQGQRNKVLMSYGLDPIYLDHEGRPNRARKSGRRVN